MSGLFPSVHFRKGPGNEVGPTCLRAALGTALEIESFSLAARRRARPVRTVHESPTKVNTESYVDPLEDTLKRNSGFLTELKTPSFVK